MEYHCGQSNYQLISPTSAENSRMASATLARDSSVVTTGDKLVLRGINFHGFHGVKPEERNLGQKFSVDVDVWTDLRAAGISDNLSDSISYVAIYRIVKEVVEGQPKNLLESVAELIASKTLNEHPQVTAVRVQVRKPQVPVHGHVDYMGVEITRYQTSHT